MVMPSLEKPRTRKHLPDPDAVDRLMPQKLAFMDSSVFRQRNVEQQLFADEPMDLPSVDWYQPTLADDEDKPTNCPRHMQADEERLMFLRYNYCKRRLGELKRKIVREGACDDLMQQVQLWRGRFEHLREYLVRTNLALVLAMAKRTRLGQLDFAEIVSEGNMALLRAVDKFSVDRGFKFSTYACRAILKAFSRTAMKASRRRSRFPVEFEPDLERSDWADRKRETVEAECVEDLKHIVDQNLADLTTVEQTVIRQRFNWRQRAENPLTLEQVGKIIGVTKERVRQIQNKALAKIRQVMEKRAPTASGKSA